MRGVARCGARGALVTVRSTAIALAVVMACAASYLTGLTVGYGGCVAGASEIHTNKILRGM